MKLKPKQIAMITSAVALGTTVSVGISYMITKLLVEVAVNRDVPKILRSAENIFAGAVSTKEEIDAFLSSSENLASTKTEDIQITASDGTTLIGHFYHSNSPKRIIIAMHGWRSSWTRDFGLVSNFWKENDCSILFVEQRGQNGSGGEHIGFGLIERYDCLDWVNYVKNNCDPTIPVYLAGISMGASTVLMASGMDLPSCVHGIIADCGFTSPRDIWKHVVNKNLKLVYIGPREMIADEMFRKKLNMKTSEYSTIKAMEKCSVPILFIHGAKDKFVPIHMTYKNYLACNSPKRLFVAPGAGHAMSYFHEKEGYERATKEFWNDYDLLSVAAETPL